MKKLIHISRALHPTPGLVRGGAKCFRTFGIIFDYPPWKYANTIELRLVSLLSAHDPQHQRAILVLLLYTHFFTAQFQGINKEVEYTIIILKRQQCQMVLGFLHPNRTRRALFKKQRREWQHTDQYVGRSHHAVAYDYWYSGQSRELLQPCSALLTTTENKDEVSFSIKRRFWRFQNRIKIRRYIEKDMISWIGYEIRRFNFENPVTNFFPSIHSTILLCGTNRFNLPS